MSKDYQVSGIHQINRWLWQNLRAALPDDFKAYTTPGHAANGLVPIIPSQQLPQFTNIVGGAPFMIYNYSVEGGEQVWETRDKIGYVIYDDNESRLRRIHNFMVQLLKRMDWTAADVNFFLDSTATVENPNEFDFKWVQVDNAAGPQPFENEGGRHGALIMATASYTREIFGVQGARPLNVGLGMRS